MKVREMIEFLEGLENEHQDRFAVVLIGQVGEGSSFVHAAGKAPNWDQPSAKSGVAPYTDIGDNRDFVRRVITAWFQVLGGH